MENPFILEKISIDPPREKIYQRLGYKKSTTEISASHKKESERLIGEAASLIRLQGMFQRFDIMKNDGREIHLVGDMTFVSGKLSSFLRNCREAVLMAATAGSVVMDAIREKARQDYLSAAVVYDATASEMTDAALDWIMDYLDRQLRREGKTLLPRRFSAGYADFFLHNQKIIYEKLRMKHSGIEITESFMLIPEKTVTAIGGIYG